jgi:hypothetical protein
VETVKIRLFDAWPIRQDGCLKAHFIQGGFSERDWESFSAVVWKPDNETPYSSDDKAKTKSIKKVRPAKKQG